MALELADPELVTLLRLAQFETEQAAEEARLQQLRIAEAAAAEQSEPLPVTKEQPNALRHLQARFFGGNQPANPTSTAQDTSTFSSSMASASAMAESAAAYANRMFKSGFARLHAEHAPNQAVPPVNEDKKDTASDIE